MEEEPEDEFIENQEESSTEASIPLISKPVLSAQSSIDENIISLE
jgi:hypothetical protein